MKSKPNILLLYTGGTIGMVKDFDSGALKVFNFDKLLQNIPELKQLDCVIETMSFETPIDSSNITPLQWAKIATVIEQNYNNFDGFVILHGSDTMSYSASALSFMLQNLNKPIVFTGSQLPIGDLRTDAKENLITAIQVASLRDNDEAVIQEVCLYFEYKLYRGNRTVKISAEHFNAFISPNYPELAESGVHLRVNKNVLLQKQEDKELLVIKDFDTNVVIIKVFPGINVQVLKAILGAPRLKGVILETYGAGNAPTDAYFVSTLQKAIEQGIHIVNVTQCSGGSVNMGHYETSTLLKEIGVISGKDITTEAAITKLMYLLGQDVPAQEFKELFETSLCGELS
ncbi:asparaginase [Flavobacterium arcticum]|uniref:asparaginase n=1 Tax=Flavobacterium arcticum TaxID=1784713 RepID=A0A345HA84_9FLAO|nr:asparaginase [Flavobacterium arcticum]AXG73494.1 asparaginase [Flavobacterium arcticum]KAF2513283.1 asparaginase [Flavobacterium arcticum]